MGKPDVVFQLKVTLRGIRPPIWRRVLVPGDITLLELHEVLQIVIGWTNSHLHPFKAKGIYYGTPDPELGVEIKNERRIRLSGVMSCPKDRITGTNLELLQFL